MSDNIFSEAAEMPEEDQFVTLAENKEADRLIYYSENGINENFDRGMFQ